MIPEPNGNPLEDEAKSDAIRTNLPSLGGKIELYWPIEEKKIFEGIGHSTDTTTNINDIHYTEEEIETLRFQNKAWTFKEDVLFSQQQQ